MQTRDRSQVALLLASRIYFGRQAVSPVSPLAQMASSSVDERKALALVSKLTGGVESFATRKACRELATIAAKPAAAAVIRKAGGVRRLQTILSAATEESLVAVCQETLGLLGEGFEVSKGFQPTIRPPLVDTTQAHARVQDGHRPVAPKRPVGLGLGRIDESRKRALPAGYPPSLEGRRSKGLAKPASEPATGPSSALPEAGSAPLFSPGTQQRRGAQREARYAERLKRAKAANEARKREECGVQVEPAPAAKRRRCSLRD